VRGDAHRMMYDLDHVSLGYDTMRSATISGQGRIGIRQDCDQAGLGSGMTGTRLECGGIKLY